MAHPATNDTQGDAAREAQLRQTYAALQPGDRVEVVHHIKIGFREHESRTVGVVVGTQRHECGMDGGFRRGWDDKYWFDHLLLRRDDGELTTVTMDEYTEIAKLDEAASGRELNTSSERQ